VLEFGEPSSASDVVTVYEYAVSSVAVRTASLVMLGASGWSDTTDSCVATVLEFPAASIATPAAISMVTVPSADGVIVAVYDAPLPDSEADPPLTVISLAVNPVTELPNVTVTANVEPVAGDDPVYAIVVVGGPVSTVNAVSDRALAVLPALSVKVTVQVYAASPSVDSVSVLEPDAIVLVEPNPHPLVPPTAIVPASATLIVTSGEVSVVGVVAAVVSLGVATVKSAVTAPESADESAVPTFPAASV